MNALEKVNPDLINEETEKPLSIRLILDRYIYRWPVFVSGIILSLFIAYMYLRYVTPTYLVNSTLLIKDEKKGNMSGGSDILNHFDLFGNTKVVENEIEILKSKNLMQKVVQRLNLSANLVAEGRIKSFDLYKNDIVVVSVVEIDNRWYGKNLTLTFPTKDTYQFEEQGHGSKIVGPLNVLQRNELGVFKIVPSSQFSKFNKNALTVVFYKPEEVVSNLLSKLTINLVGKQSTVLNLSFQETVPKRGLDILNTLIQVYNEAALIDKNQTTQSTIEFIDERLKLITGELTNVEKDVEGFKSSRGLTDISNDANLFLENVKLNDGKLSEINLQISVIKDVMRYVNNPSTGEKVPSTLGINDPILLDQITKLGELQLQKDQLLATTTESNPIIVPLSKKIQTIKSSIKVSVNNILNSLEASKVGLDRNNARFQASIRRIPGQERELISIKRQQTIKESLYLYLLQKKEEAALSYASTIADSRIVDSAYYSPSPIFPNHRMVYGFAIIVGLILSVGYVFVKHLVNNKVESISDLKVLTSAPVLAEISFDEGFETIVVHANSRKAIAEQFRSFRTNMQYLQGKSLPGIGKVTLFTSSMSGEGKTFVASNLAAAFAVSGKKTILLELDLRKPKISKYLKLENKVGLSNYLIGQAELQDIIHPMDFNANLFVLGSGPIPPNPSELLIQPEMQSLIDYLKVHFDEIVIDSPPIGLVTDAQILSNLSDATIYVVRHNVTLKEQCFALERLYRNAKFPKLNVVLNGITSSAGYGYGYGYGYYSDDNDRKTLSLKRTLKDIYKRF